MASVSRTGSVTSRKRYLLPLYEDHVSSRNRSTVH